MVDIASDLLQVWEVIKALVDAEIPSIVDGAFSPGGPVFLEVLLDISGFVFDVQARRHSLSDDTRPKDPRGALDDFSIKEKLDPIRSPKVNVFADDSFKEFSAANRAVEDLGAGKLHLPHRKLMAISGLDVFDGERQWQTEEPFSKEAFDVLRPQLLTDILQPERIGTAEKTVVETFIRNAFVLQLSFCPFMAVETHTNGQWGVGTDLDEARPKVGIIDVEIVMLHEHRLAGV